MSWSAVRIEHLRMDFILIAREPDVNMSEVCRQFNISRKTGYKWMARYTAGGVAALVDASRRPNSSPLQVIGDIVAELVRLRGKREHRGPKKLRAMLLRRGFSPDVVPSLATIGRILRRAGLSEPKGRGRQRRCASHTLQIVTHVLFLTIMESLPVTSTDGPLPYSPTRRRPVLSGLRYVVYCESSYPRLLSHSARSLGGTRASDSCTARNSPNSGPRATAAAASTAPMSVATSSLIMGSS